MSNISKDLLKLGLLHGSLLVDEESLEEQPEWLSYPHKLFQEFMGGYFAAKRLSLDPSEVSASTLLLHVHSF